jgi:phage-related protein
MTRVLFLILFALIYYKYKYSENESLFSRKSRKIADLKRFKQRLKIKVLKKITAQIPHALAICLKLYYAGEKFFIEMSYE